MVFAYQILVYNLNISSEISKTEIKDCIIMNIQKKEIEYIIQNEMRIAEMKKVKGKLMNDIDKRDIIIENR